MINFKSESLHVSKAGVRSKAVDLLFIRCLLLPFLWVICVCSIFCCAVLCVLSSFAVILMGKRELNALLCCLTGVL